MDIKSEIIQAIDELQHFIDTESPDRAALNQYLRKTPLPFIACYHSDLRAGESFELSCQFLQTLGRYNIAYAVGICMNQYIAYSIAYLPLAEESALHRVKSEFLQMVLENRWILAVSSFDDFIRDKNEPGARVTCHSQSNGSIVCNGTKNFQSNITDADVVLFSADFENKGTQLFYLFLNNSDDFTIGKPVFTGAMADADTRPLKFTEAVLEQHQMVPVGSEEEVGGLHAFTRVVFAFMAMAPYLGGARTAIDEAASFVKSVTVDQTPLASLDGNQVDFGRAEIRYQICQNLIERFGQSLNILSKDNMAVWLGREYPKAMAAKYHITGECEELVSFARKVIGTRSLMPDHMISLISQQILYAPLHPVVNAKIEREIGMGALLDK